MKNINYYYLLLISLVSAMGGLLFGYDWVVIGGGKTILRTIFRHSYKSGNAGLSNE